MTISNRPKCFGNYSEEPVPEYESCHACALASECRQYKLRRCMGIKYNQSSDCQWCSSRSMCATMYSKGFAISTIKDEATPFKLGTCKEKPVPGTPFKIDKQDSELLKLVELVKSGQHDFESIVDSFRSRGRKISDLEQQVKSMLYAISVIRPIYRIGKGRIAFAD